MVFFGDGAVETGVFYESLNFAALKKLRVVFVCENNLYSVYSPLPVALLEGRLLGSGLASRSDLDDMAATLHREIDAAVAFARQSPFPDAQLMSAHVTAAQAA